MDLKSSLCRIFQALSMVWFCFVFHEYQLHLSGHFGPEFWGEKLEKKHTVGD